MRHEIFQVENVLSPEHFEEVNSVLFSDSFPTFFYAASCEDPSVDPSSMPNKTTWDVPQFVHTFMKDYQVNSPYFEVANHVMNNFMKKVGVKSLTCERMKFNITLARPDLSGRHQTPHVDSLVENGYTSIFYLNDSDGDTLFFSDNSVIKRVTPKKNSMVCFPNTTVHCAEMSKETPFRGVINYNFKLPSNVKFVTQGCSYVN